MHFNSIFQACGKAIIQHQQQTTKKSPRRINQTISLEIIGLRLVSTLVDDAQRMETNNLEISRRAYADFDS